MNARFLLPYLMGQRRDGLRRVLDVDSHPWEVLAPAPLRETRIDDPVARLDSLGRLYALLAARVATQVRNGLRPVSLAGDCVSSLGMTTAWFLAPPRACTRLPCLVPVA